MSEEAVARITVVIHQEQLNELTWDEYAALTDIGHPRRDMTQRELIGAVDKIAEITLDGVKLESAGRVKLSDFAGLWEQIGAAVSGAADVKNSARG